MIGVHLARQGGAVDLLLVPHDDSRLVALVRAQERDVMARYGVDDAGPGLGPGSICLLARDGDDDAGCAGGAPLAPGVGEVKRMYVAPHHRGRRLAARLLTAVEQEAQQRGLHTLRLEAGTEQPEALAVYERAGYHRIPCYGYFADDPSTICFEKQLTEPEG